MTIPSRLMLSTERKWLVEVANLSGATVEEVWKVNECLRDALLHFLAQKKYIIIDNFGAFKARVYYARMKSRLGRPVTPEQAKRKNVTISFLASRDLKDRAYYFYALRNKDKVDLFKNQLTESA